MSPKPPSTFSGKSFVSLPQSPDFSCCCFGTSHLSQQLSGLKCYGQTLKQVGEPVPLETNMQKASSPFFSPWSLLFGDLLLHQTHTNNTASTRQHCHRLVLPTQCGRQEPPGLPVISCSSYSLKWPSLPLLGKASCSPGITKEMLLSS